MAALFLQLFAAAGGAMAQTTGQKDMPQNSGVQNALAISGVGIEFPKDIPIVLLTSIPPHMKKRLSPTCKAFVVQGDNHIYIRTDTQLYKDAMDGDTDSAIELAGIIAHEYNHLKHPEQGEAGAYQAEITMLLKLGAKQASIAATIAARNQVLKAERDK